MARLLLVVFALLPACTIYFDDDDNDDDDDDCGYLAEGPPRDPSIPATLLRNPDTGECQDVGGGYPCDDRCGPCPAIDIATPDWAQCYAECEGQDEASCAADPSCRTSYYEDPITDGGIVYQGCWGVAPSGPIEPTCEGLDAYGCSRTNHCAAVYLEQVSSLAPVESKFSRCLPERVTGCYSDDDCSTGERCTAADECLPPPGCTGGVCPDVCYGRCIPVDPAACESITSETACSNRGDCVAVYLGDNCTCYPDSGCSCETLTYDRCEPR